MFEALFILTTLDAGTRVGRYLLQDTLGNIWKPMADTSNITANVFASTLVVAAWGYFLIQGVKDPLGGINSLWPLFGIANQLLASIALRLATTVILKMQLTPGESAVRKHPALALVTLLPLVWLLTVTVTAGIQKISSPDPRIGFLAQANALDGKAAALNQAVEGARKGGDPAQIAGAEKALRDNRVLRFNQYLDAFVAAVFLVLVAALVCLCVAEWYLLISRRRKAELRETAPAWLPDYAIVEGKPLNVAGVVALAVPLLKELSGEADLDRARQTDLACLCERHDTVAAAEAEKQLYLHVTEARYKSIRRCC
jgi:carbon starvation protein